MSDELRRRITRDVRSVVVKIGTNVLTGDDGRIDQELIEGLAASIARLRDRGLRVTVVSSGAIGRGQTALGLDRRPDDLPRLQACAAVGQARLIQLFDQALAAHGHHAAQILITRDDFEHRTRYLNIRNCVGALHEYGAVPILNENDTVSVEEIRYGDNDIIAALVTNNLRADLLVLLTAVEGLYRDAARGDIVDVVAEDDETIHALVDGSRSSRGTGGMQSKLEAVRMVTRAGEHAVIVGGRIDRVLDRVLDGEPVGTLFLPQPAKMNSRKRWIAFSARSRGKLTVDEGAVRALAERGKSLLASGITDVGGAFREGDLVTVLGPTGREIARGLVNYDAGTVRKIQGHRSSDFQRILGEKPYDEVIHRDNLVLRE